MKKISRVLYFLSGASIMAGIFMLIEGKIVITLINFFVATCTCVIGWVRENDA